jgi:branched-chain amino acid aminotransferase
MSDPGPRFVWVDGMVRPAAAEHLSAFDRGFLLGDGVFETLRARHGRVTELTEHAARLRRSAEGLAIALPTDLEPTMAQGIADLLAAEGLDGPDGDASVRVTVSRGRWPSRGLLPPAGEPLTATIVIQSWPVARHTSIGPVPEVAVVTSALRRDPANPMATIKTTSRADFVYARLEARRAGAEDAVFMTVSGHLCEATQANIFLVRRAPDGRTDLATPALDCGVLPGTTRSWLLDWAARVGLRPVEGWLTPEDAGAASEAFLSSSVAGILPVTRFDGRPVGGGRPGAWTLRARAAREAFIVDG